jgi:hypothetical protein
MKPFKSDKFPYCRVTNFNSRVIAYQDLTDGIEDTEQVVVVPASHFAFGSKTNLDRFLLFEQVECDVAQDCHVLRRVVLLRVDNMLCDGAPVT